MFLWPSYTVWLEKAAKTRHEICIKERPKFSTLSNRLFKYCSRIWVFFPRLLAARPPQVRIRRDVQLPRPQPRPPLRRGPPPILGGVHSRTCVREASASRIWCAGVDGPRRPPAKINSGDKFGRALPRPNFVRENKFERPEADRIWYAGGGRPRRPPTKRGAGGPCRPPAKINS